MGGERKTVKRSGGRFAKGSAPGPGRAAKLTDQILRDIARDFRLSETDVRAMALLEDRDAIEELLKGAPDWLRDRVRRCGQIADLAEAALIRRLKAAAGL